MIKNWKYVLSLRGSRATLPMNKAGRSGLVQVGSVTAPEMLWFPDKHYIENLRKKIIATQFQLLGFIKEAYSKSYVFYLVFSDKTTELKLSCNDFFLKFSMECLLGYHNISGAGIANNVLRAFAVK